MTTEPPKTGTAAPVPAPQATGVVQGTGVPATAGSKPVTTVTTGTLIMGTYEIEKLINSGGMGEVYRGRNIHNGEPVAIKIVLPSLAHDPKIVALFQKESTTLSRLNHDAIVRYHVFTVDPTIGRPCMVMEFVSGTAMSDRIEQGPMPADDVRMMLRRVASGLDKAHRAGVVHRDLSPDNVILEDGNVEHAKLIDFGIAKSTAMGAGTLLQGQFAGKFNWVAPEQLGAFGGHVDGRSDIYSLALVTAAASKGEVLPMGASIVDAVGKRSSVPDLTGVDPSLVPLLSWMLQPDPGLRPESMAKVMAAVDNPDLIPQAAPPAPKAVDPNRTIIGGALPPFDLSATEAVAATAATSEPPVTPKSLPPLAGTAPPAEAGWGMPAERAQTAPPQGATVISSVAPMAPPPMPEEEPEDFSPFGAPGAAAKPQAPMAASVAAPVAKKGKGGLVAVLVILAAGAGGAGAYFGGVFDPKPAVVADETPAVADPAADEAKAAEAATAAKAAEEEAAKVAEAEKKAADEAAAATADVSKVEEDVAAKATEEAAQKAAADAAAAKLAEEEAARTAAAEAEKKAADEAAAKVAEEAAAQKAAEDAAAAKAAEDAAAAKAAADAKAADEAAKVAAENAAKSDDPVVKQTAFLAAMTPAACSYVSVADPKPEGFVLHGFAKDTKPLEDMAAAWETETGTKPEVLVHLINDDQCALLDFINNHPTELEVKPIAVIMDPSMGESVKTGRPIKGSISGLGAGALTVLHVSPTGGVNNLQKFISTSSDGTIGFTVTISMLKDSAPMPQLFVAIESGEKLQRLLAAIKGGTSAKALIPFIEVSLKKEPGPIKLGLAFIRLEN